MISKITAIPLAYGLEDLIAGASPTFAGWDTDPTDAADITDDNPATICTTGTYSAAAWQAAYMTWTLGDTYHIMMTGFGRIITSAGSGFIYAQVYDGTNWRPPRSYCAGGNAQYGTWTVYSGVGSAIRLEFVPDGICDVSPYISTFSAWRIK